MHFRLMFICFLRLKQTIILESGVNDTNTNIVFSLASVEQFPKKTNLKLVRYGCLWAGPSVRRQRKFCELAQLREGDAGVRGPHQ